MALQLINLNDRTRQLMLAEIESDMAAGKLYLSPRLSPTGRAAYPGFIIEAARAGNESHLAANLAKRGMLNDVEEKRKPSGGTTWAKVPVTAPETLAEGEFNRYYLRALCLRAAQDGIEELEIYRAKAVASPRPDSEAKIGMPIGGKNVVRRPARAYRCRYCVGFASWSKFWFECKDPRCLDGARSSMPVAAPLRFLKGCGAQNSA